MRRWLTFSALLVAACGGGAANHGSTEPDRDTVVVSVVGTSDLHGRIERVAVLAGFLTNLRGVREAAGGGVVLVDAGDMFQGTLESNTVEGASVVRAYNAVGYTAAAVGNHEFDFGPEGPATTPSSPADDPRGALEARAREARFPILTANILDDRTGRRVEWPGLLATTTARVAGVTVGIVGVSTEETLRTTLAANVADLRMAPLAHTIVREAARLRRGGASVVIVAAHAGGDCQSFDDPEDLGACDPDEEIFHVAQALPVGAVDVIVAGHTHAAVAHFVNGIPVIQSNALGTHFGRVDVTVDVRSRAVVSTAIHPPRALCQSAMASLEDCAPGRYEGAAVTIDPVVLAAVQSDLTRARELAARPVGVRLETPFPRSGHGESPLANLITDLQMSARPGADLALINGGGIRSSLPAGELTYGQFFEMFPFDNRFALVRVTAGELAQMFARTLATDHGLISPSGIRVVAACEGQQLRVRLLDSRGEEIAPERELTVVTSDFLATGGDEMFTLALGRGAVQIEDGPPMREALLELLHARGGSLRADDPATFDREHPRVSYPGERPVRCPAPPN